MEGFFLGESVPVNEKLSEIFLQLHISEKSGRGVPKISEMCGKEDPSFRENSIVVIIPLERVNKVGNKVGKTVGNKKALNSRRQKIILEMRNNPNITTVEIHTIPGVSEMAVEKNISFLKENGYNERVGQRRQGIGECCKDYNVDLRVEFKASILAASLFMRNIMNLLGENTLKCL